MKQYFGTKSLLAIPMNLGDYNRYRGWDIPGNEDPATEGYLVEYPPEPENAPNHPGHEGYISWSPKTVFEKTYRTSGDLSFGHGLEILRAGGRVARKGWNGKGMFIFLVQGSQFVTNREPLISILGEGVTVNYHAHIDMRTADGTIVPWVASQSDMLAWDWEIVHDA